MRCIFLLAVACAFATSAEFSDESDVTDFIEHPIKGNVQMTMSFGKAMKLEKSIQADPSQSKVFDSQVEIGMAPNEEFVEDASPVQVSAKEGAVLTESELASKGKYWKWSNKFKTSAKGQYRMRQLWKKGKVAKQNWALIKVAKKKVAKKKVAKKKVATKKVAKKVAPKTDLAQAGWGRRRRRNNSGSAKKVAKKGAKKFFPMSFKAELVEGSSTATRRICARLYQHSNFRGRVYNVYHNVAFTRGFNDQMSSMRVYSGCRVRIYEHSNFRGRHKLVGPGGWNYHWIRRVFGNDKLSSVRVYRYHSRRRRHRGRRICARLYQHSNFRGRVYTVYHNVAFTRGFNDQMSSMRVYHGCRVRIYEHSHYRGRHRFMGPGSYNYHWIRRHFGNDKLSSVRVYPGHTSSRRRRARRSHGRVRGCRLKCYNPGPKVCAWLCGGHRRIHHHRRVRWHPLACKTTAAASNRAGIVLAKQPSHFTMVGGGINNRYRHWNHLSAFEESYPAGSNWRCDTGFGPGHVTCYARSCRLPGYHCITRAAYKHGVGTAQANLPGGYVATGGGIYNHYRHWNKAAAFEASFPVGVRSWKCDMGLGIGKFHCYVRGCKAPRNKGLHCYTHRSGHGNSHNVQCRKGYSVTGCGQNELRRQWNHLSGFEQWNIHGNGCLCDSGFGAGNNMCFARCCRQWTRYIHKKVVHRL